MRLSLLALRILELSSCIPERRRGLQIRLGNLQLLLISILLGGLRRIVDVGRKTLNQRLPRFDGVGSPQTSLEIDLFRQARAEFAELRQLSNQIRLHAKSFSG